ncbi:enoyl-CoA hydratase-related protein [Gordonia westfalica]|uniref:Enoyl-CoA hydratase-related protein n=1 Tax=Gordonia westfalica TaxID=158898 RepID=A0ABU2GTK4_9ACTN|nr:enoyl-CoA hydratase-related protein [Gordonia westfalica]MDS1114778.1 enoyl-CoA hydratase-related protein [Gordonia westfalica]
MDSGLADARAGIMRSLYAALAEGDSSRVGELLDPAFVGRVTPGMPLGLGGEYVGAESMQRDFWWRLGSAFRVHAEPDAFHPLDNDRVQVHGRYRGTARATGRTVDAQFIHTVTFAGERISRLDQLTDSAAWQAALDGSCVATPPYPGPAIGDLETIDYSVADGVAQVILDRPDARNAIDLRLAEEILAVARAIAADARVRAVLIAGNGPALTVGGDIAYFDSAPPEALGALTARMTEPFHEAFRILDRIDAPIVTAAHGAVAGGGLGFVYTADIVIAAQGSVFTTAFSGIGLSGDGGGTWHLPRLVGEARARRMYLENLRVDAARAESWGLVSEVVPDAEVRQRALATATRLAAGPTRAFGRQRALLRDSWDSTLSEQLRAETDALAVTGATHDAQNAVAAFRAGTRPTFEGR